TKLLGIAGANTVANSIVLSNDGSGNYLYITGYTEGNLDGQTKTGVRDLFITKYDLSGTRQWTKLLGSAGSSTNGNAIAFDNNGTMYAAGSINGDIGGQTNPAAPNNALMITRFVK
ncbi:MAG TPA: SBBP repeat-containing protein, partial [Leptospiraceae bacterium]|nr:SBBP repeat-containing protein [Leptospiraceae bacterium]